MHEESLCFIIYRTKNNTPKFERYEKEKHSMKEMVSACEEMQIDKGCLVGHWGRRDENYMKDGCSLFGN